MQSRMQLADYFNQQLRSRERDDMHAIGEPEGEGKEVPSYDPANGMTCMQFSGATTGYEKCTALRSRERDDMHAMRSIRSPKVNLLQVTIPRTG